jgi:hypothetical protein
MATGTCTVTINAPFFQEIKEANRSLRGRLGELCAICLTPPSSHRPKHFASLLAKLRDQLASQFSLEEAYGYFDEPVAVAPNLSEAAQRLRHEHAELYLQIVQIAEEAESILIRDRQARAMQQLIHRFVRFLARLQHHESAENELILDAYTSDVGVGD